MSRSEACGIRGGLTGLVVGVCFGGGVLVRDDGSFGSMGVSSSCLLLTVPIDVADVVAFLASEDSGYITGASVEVTGMRLPWGGRGLRRSPAAL